MLTFLHAAFLITSFVKRVQAVSKIVPGFVSVLDELLFQFTRLHRIALNSTVLRNLTKLRVKFSPLNEHRFRHNFNCLSPLCVCGTGNEDGEHFLLHCPQFDLMRADLFSQLADVPGLDITSMDSKDLCELLLYGTSELNVVENRIIIEATISFIERSKRFC